MSRPAVPAPTEIKVEISQPASLAAWYPEAELFHIFVQRRLSKVVAVIMRVIIHQLTRHARVFLKDDMVCGLLFLFGLNQKQECCKKERKV